MIFPKGFDLMMDVAMQLRPTRTMGGKDPFNAFQSAYSSSYLSTLVDEISEATPIDLSGFVKNFMNRYGEPDMGQIIGELESQQMSDSMRAEVLLSQDGDTFRLPVNPPDADPSFSTGHTNYNFDTVEVGTFKAIGRTGLTSTVIESFFPAKYMPYCVVPENELLTPDEYIEKIRGWKLKNRPIRLIITGQINMAFAIENFEWYKQKGTNDIYYTLDLEEYAFANIDPKGYDAPINNQTGLKDRAREAAGVVAAKAVRDPRLVAAGMAIAPVLQASPELKFARDAIYDQMLKWSISK